MSGVEAEGYTKVVHKLYNKGFYQFEDERLPNANVRFSDVHVATAEEAGAYGFTFTSIVKPEGDQLRLIYLSFWSSEPGDTAYLVITQTGGTSHQLPAGQVDAIMSSRTPRYGTLVNPLHILEGTITFSVVNPTAGAHYGLSLWGDENKPQVHGPP